MSDVWSVLLALTVIVLPLGLAWLLLRRMERRKARRDGSGRRAGHRDNGRRR